MKAILLDSDILINVARGLDGRLLERWAELSGSDAVIAYSPVTVAEMWHGARLHEYKLLEALFRALTCVPIGPEIGGRAGDYLRQFAKSHSVELGDALIAATASIHKLSLWTHNRKHYPMKDCLFFSPAD
ncbi:MAG: type II toxin-antitoxin system VapC family toxin [Terriglobia bacterium]